ncbi:kinase-like domain-containing protein [Rhizophagus diaphanus]|nr:kinase-like domain-containing protein [Rhizophagus diaphanus] [Rhizophagus sp. MUCL 43196]
MVMEYAENGSLRQILNNSFNSMKWDIKLEIIKRTANSLKDIHSQGLIHHDFHCGNILNINYNYTYITDLGLFRPSNVIPSQDEYKKMYGVLPYVAPEVLIGKEYTQESNIYGFGIIAYEVCTGLPPYHDIAHDKVLAISICNGLRPKTNYKIPQLILDIIKQCWDADPLKRPKANELYDSKLKINEKFTSTSLPYNGTTLSYTTNPQAVYTSRLLDFKNLPEPKNAIDSKDNDLFEHSGNSCLVIFTKFLKCSLI